ncbi:MAG: ribonuclease P protein component [Saprospiraceae bacterium]|jgi:ribonuclease P protein component
MHHLKFDQERRLKRRKIIEKLFKNGHSFGMYPLRAVWIPVEQSPENCTVQMGVSVAKKKFPHAVDRNRIRRQVREAFRIHQGLLAGLEAPLALMVLYTAAEALPFSDIEGAMVRLLKKIGKQVVKEG